jgi:hypothetical protein
MRMIAHRNGQKVEILLPTPDRMLESIDRRERLEAAAKRALDYLTDHGTDLDGEDEELVADIRLDLENALEC